MNQLRAIVVSFNDLIKCGATFNVKFDTAGIGHVHFPMPGETQFRQRILYIERDLPGEPYAFRSDSQTHTEDWLTQLNIPYKVEFWPRRTTGSTE